MNELNTKEVSQVAGGCHSSRFNGNIVTPVIIIGDNPNQEVLNTVNNLLNNIFSIFK